VVDLIATVTNVELILLPPASQADELFLCMTWGSLRFTPGFMLSPASQVHKI